MNKKYGLKTAGSPAHWRSFNEMSAEARRLNLPGATATSHLSVEYLNILRKLATMFNANGLVLDDDIERLIASMEFQEFIEEALVRQK